MRVKSLEDAELILQKLSCDMGIHRNPRKGTLNAPEEILEDVDFDRHVLVDEVFPDEFDLEETHGRIYENTVELAKYGRHIISIGGDHSVSYPVVKALKEENPEMQLIWLDAHLDLKEKVEGHVSHDVVVRQLVEEGLFTPDEIYFVGITCIDHDEQNFLDEYDFNVYSPDELSEFIEEYPSGEACYLSVDIDALNEDQAPGTGYTDGRMSLEEVEKAVKKLRPSHADLVEVAPSLDENQKTVNNAREILQTLIRRV